jgi:hypothetical protein
VITASADTTPAVVDWRDDLRAALPGWVVARIAVAVAWVIQLVDVRVRLDGEQPHHASLGLLAYDADVYRNIAELGYGHTVYHAVRFPPLLPLLGFNGTGILLVVNLGALLAGALVHRLVVEVLGDRDMARRAATLLALAPPAFTLVWGYSEALFISLSAAFLLMLHRRQWAVAGVLGLLASLARTPGVLLAVPAAVEIWRTWRQSKVTLVGLLARALAVVGPVAGVVGYLLWVEVATGAGMSPVEIQSDLRHGTNFPPLRLLESLGELVTEPFNDGLHTPFAFLMVALVWVCWRRFPPAWTALAVVSATTILAAGLLNSLERYAWGTVPILVAGAAVAGGRWWRPTVVLSVIAMIGMTVLAWYGPFVP